ncbi:calpain A isoform X1 [Arctopsyche grandis]|uniref:calpain A isoform X1 n=1 Tax=Arctopsyche grandis TaxID=121162 RepID=UPI00406D880E
MSEITEKSCIKVDKRPIARMKIASKPKTSPLVKSNSSYDNTTKSIYNIEELSSKNSYSNLNPPMVKNVPPSPNTGRLFGRPGLYKPFWMNNSKVSKSAQDVVLPGMEETLNDFHEALNDFQHQGYKGSVAIKRDSYNKLLEANKSKFFNNGNAWSGDGNIVSKTSTSLNEGNLSEKKQILDISNFKSNNLFNNNIYGSDIVDKNNHYMRYKKFGFSKIIPMYTKGVNNNNKFRDIIINKVDTKLPIGRFPPIFRSDGQRVFRLGERSSGYGHTGREVQDFQTLRNECLGSGRLFEDPDFPPIDSSLYFSQRPDRRFEWLRPSEIADNPQLFVEGFSRFDVQQGELGDCWLLAAVANLTLHRKLFFQIVPDDQSFDEDYAGIFHFRFWQYGKWVDVVVDDRLPTYRGRLIFLHSSEQNEFWSALLEKAYAKLHGSYEALKGGSTCEAMEDFTGGVTEMYEMSEVPPNLYTILLHGYQRSSLMGCSIEPDPSVLEAETPQGLIRGHAYSITRVCYVDIETPGRQGKIPLLRLRNPWGNEAEWNGPWSDKSPEWRYIPESEKEEIGLTFDDDGEFWMSYRDFLTQFTRLEICNLNPDSLDPDETPEGCNKKWEMCVFEGEWVRGVTAGGCRNSLTTFWQNPQYSLTLTDPDEDDDQNLCTVIVALMQKNRRSQRSAGLDCLTIGFAIYKQSPNGPKPLPLDFFKYNASVARSPSFINLREVSCRFKLPPGTYCIIPSTFDANEEGEFLLRVFTEKSSTVTENDEEIGMGEIDDRVRHDIPEPPSAPEDPVRQFFLKLAGPDEEVDWLELKEILDYAMRNELGPGEGGGGGGQPPPGGTMAPPSQQQERGILEQLVCSLCTPICKELGINLDQEAEHVGQETVHLNQPGRERKR